MKVCTQMTDKNYNEHVHTNDRQKYNEGVHTNNRQKIQWKFAHKWQTKIQWWCEHKWQTKITMKVCTQMIVKKNTMKVWRIQMTVKKLQWRYAHKQQSKITMKVCTQTTDPNYSESVQTNDINKIQWRYVAHKWQSKYYNEGMHTNDRQKL